MRCRSQLPCCRKRIHIPFCCTQRLVGIDFVHSQTIVHFAHRLTTTQFYIISPSVRHHKRLNFHFQGSMRLNFLLYGIGNMGAQTGKTRADSLPYKAGWQRCSDDPLRHCQVQLSLVFCNPRNIRPITHNHLLFNLEYLEHPIRLTTTQTPIRIKFLTSWMYVLFTAATRFHGDSKLTRLHRFTTSTATAPLHGWVCLLLPM